MTPGSRFYDPGRVDCAPGGLKIPRTGGDVTNSTTRPPGSPSRPRVTSFKKREKRGLKRNSGFPGCFRPHTHTKPIPTKGPVFSVDFGVDRGPRVVVGAAELLDRAPRTVYRASSRWASTWTAASRTSQWAFNHTPQGASPAGSPGGSPSAGSPGQLDLPMNVLL